jgi:hypothetical protein
MIFSRESVHDFFKLLRERVDAMKLHQRSTLIYNVDGTGLELTYNSGNWKL